MVTVIGDRESDIYEEFDRIPDGRTHLLTRACRDRALVDGGRLFEVTESWPVRHRFALEVRAQPGRPARTADVAVRFGEVTIKRPANCSDPAAARQLTLRLVEVRELDPAVEEPIHWRLLTTHAVTTVAQALQIVAWYRERWHIEQLFRTSKSQGLDLESSQVEAAEALFNLAAIAMIAATKIMQLVLARDGTVNRPATDVVAADQLPMLEALQVRLEGKTAKQKEPASGPLDRLARLDHCAPRWLDRIRFRASAGSDHHAKRLVSLRTNGPRMEPQKCVHALAPCGRGWLRAHPSAGHSRSEDG